ncbi:hypothetical protein PCASD_20096 [Puccinia coronata f. sp. avenae]|uniref:Uncharacterized protein n=1 Tax=Puccinia coronata f. sp. avenae TaxID=200324 RepID=A0A2N5U5E1_9BASI|nr:hypothetical protein PCASD_20096 [Puccinia coronata f. sp. avenae]
MENNSPQEEGEEEEEQQQQQQQQLTAMEQPTQEETHSTNTPDFVTALEPFGLVRDKATGRRSTTLRQLPDILAKFQNSRDTLYFTDDGLKAIVSYAAQNPEQVLDNDELNKLLESAKQTNAQATTTTINHPSTGLDQNSTSSSDHTSSSSELRVRTAESPSSSNGDHAGVYYGGSNSVSPAPSEPDEQLDHLPDLNQTADNSFDSNQERTVTMDRGKTASPSVSPPKQPTIKPPHPERHRSVPIGFDSPILSRPKPPNRRKKVSSVDLHSVHSTPSRFTKPQQRPTSNTLRTQSTPGGSEELLDASGAADLQFNVLGTPFSNRQNNHSSSFSEHPHHTPTTHLTPNNLSSVILNNRQLGLYNSSQDNIEDEALPDPPDSDDNPNGILDRIRANRDDLPSSKMHTRIFQSGVGLDGYPTPTTDLQSMCEDDLVRNCEDLKIKNKELVKQITDLEEIHEQEIVKLNDELEELKQDLSTCKKSEKELGSVSSTLRFQLANMEDQMNRLTSNKTFLEKINHQTKLKYEEANAESGKLRAQLNLKEEELRVANRSIQSHASDMKKLETDCQVREDHIKNLNVELRDLQTTREILEEQKAANLDLKATIDRLKYDLEEQKVRNAGSSVAESRPVSLAGSVGQSLGAEFRKAYSSGEYPHQQDVDTGSETSGDDDYTEEFHHVVKDYAANESGADGDAIFEEIRIRRVKHRQTLVRGNTMQEGGPTSSFIQEEEIELHDAATDTDDLVVYKTVDTQTDAIPEPPPVYRPKMEDLQVQTDAAVCMSSSTTEVAPDAAAALLKLVAGIDPVVLKLAVDRIRLEMEEGSSSQPADHTAANDNVDDDDEASSASTVSAPPCGATPDAQQQQPEEPPAKNTAPEEDGWYLRRLGLSAVASLSLDGLLHSLSSFDPLSLRDLMLVVSGSGNAAQEDDSQDGEGSSSAIRGASESLMRKRLRVCSRMVVLLAATGYVFNSLLRSPTSFGVPSTSSSVSYLSEGTSCFIEALKKTSVDRQAYALGIVLPPPLNHSQIAALPAFAKIHAASSLEDLIDFNAVGAGREGFVVLVRSRIGSLIRWSDLGAQIWSSVAGGQVSPT